MNKVVSNNYFLDKIASKTDAKPAKQPIKTARRDFRQVLDKVKQEVKISKHAEKRLEMRNVKLSEAKMQEVSNAMDRAKAKGIKDALIFVDGNALVASITNKTIVTCAKQEDLDSKIITNIDGAIVL